MGNSLANKEYNANLMGKRKCFLKALVKDAELDVVSKGGNSPRCDHFGRRENLPRGESNKTVV